MASSLRRAFASRRRARLVVKTLVVKTLGRLVVKTLVVKTLVVEEEEGKVSSGFRV